MISRCTNDCASKEEIDIYINSLTINTLAISTSLNWNIRGQNTIPLLS